MNFHKFLLELIFVFLLVIKCQSISEKDITPIKIEKLENNIIKEESTLFTSENFPSFKFFKIDFTSLNGASEENHFSFIKISVKLKNEYSYKSFLLYVNKTLNDFTKSTESYTDYTLQDKSPTIFLPKKYYYQSKFFYFFIQGEKNTEFIYSIETIKNNITLYESENKFNILIKPGKMEFLYKWKQGVTKGYLLISLFTSGVIEDGQDIYIEALCPNKNDLSIGKYYPYFINGVGLLIEDNELLSCKSSDDEYIYFKIMLYNNLKQTINVEFNSYYIHDQNNHMFLQKEIYENSIYISLLLGTGDLKRQCFKFTQKLEDREIFYAYVLNIRTTSSDLLVTYKFEQDMYFYKDKNISFTGLVDIDTRGQDKYTLICLENKKKYTAGVQFQIRPKFEKQLINFTKLPLLPIINGFPTYLKVDKIHSMIYRIDTRQFLYGSNTHKRIVKYHLIKLNQVDLTLSHVRCKKFAIGFNYCQNIFNTVYEMNMDLYLNYEYINSNSLYYDEYVYVTCNDENKNCEFLLDVNLLDDDTSYPTQLIQYKNYWQTYYYKPISKSYIDKYKISLSNKLEENSKLVIILYMFSGDADLTIYDYNNNEANIDLKRVLQDTGYYSIGKKKYIVYNIKPFNNNLDYNLREIILKITCLSSGYYSVKYYITNDSIQNNNLYFSLPVGEINFDKITYGEGKKNYILSSLLSMSKISYYHSESNNEYYITINSVNCILDVEFMGKKYIDREIQIFFYQKEIKKDNLTITLNELDSNTNDKNEFCIYYIAANSAEFQRNAITINEGVVHSMTLNDKIETVTYRYPYPYDEKIVSISLYKYYKGDLEVRVDINNKYTSHILTMKNIHYKKLVLYVDVLKKYCSKVDQNIENYNNFINLSPININIRLPIKKPKNEENINRFQIEVLSSGKTPTYIRNGEMRFDSLVVGQYSTSGKKKMKYVYYYSDIGIDEYPCEIILNNKFGSSEAIAKIVPKDKIDLFPNWDRRVRLPTIDDNDKTNYLKYDYEFNRIIINKKDVEICQKGCEIYIGVFTRETSVYFQINDFFIMLNKNYKNEPTNLLFNQNIDDSITKYIDTKYYISHLENENIDKLVFTFNSDFCSLCIIMVDSNEDYNIQKLNKCDWKLDNIINGYKNYMLSIKSNDNKLIGKDLTSVKFISKISSHIKQNKDNYYYSLKINKQDSDLPMIINVDSTNNEIAQLDSQNGLAYYSIRIHEYQLINEINLCVISQEKIINDNLVLYAKIVSQKDYNENGFNDTLFKEDYSLYDISSKNNKEDEPKNYLNIKIPNNKEEDKVILLLVKCNSMNKVDLLLNHYVKIMVAYYKPNSNTSLKNNNINFYNLYLESPQLFLPLSKDKYSVVVINCLKGKGKVIINDQNSVNKNEIILESNSANTEYKIILDINDNYDIERKFASLKIKNMAENVNKETFMFYIYYYNKNIKNNIEYLDSNKDNIIYYPIVFNVPKHKSLSYYLNINDLYKADDILIEMSFNNKYINKNSKLNALGALINDEFIYGNIMNEQQIIFSPSFGKTYYNPDNNNIYYLFEKSEIDKYKKYFGYYIVSISNNYICYEKNDINDNKNDIYVKVKLIPYKATLINDCIEIVNKYDTYINSENKNKVINSNQQDSPRNSISYKSLVFIIIVIALIVLCLVFRCIRKKNIIQKSDYFNKNYLLK